MPCLFSKKFSGVCHLGIDGNYLIVASNLRDKIKRNDRENGKVDVFWHERVLNILSCCFSESTMERSVDSAVAVMMEGTSANNAANRTSEFPAGSCALSRRMDKSLHALLENGISACKRTTGDDLVAKRRRKLDRDAADFLNKVGSLFRQMGRRHLPGPTAGALYSLYSTLFVLVFYSIRHVPADGKYCLTGGSDRTVRLWNPTRIDPAYRPTPAAAAAAFADGSGDVRELSTRTVSAQEYYGGSHPQQPPRSLPSALPMQTYANGHVHPISSIATNGSSTVLLSASDKTLLGPSSVIF